MQVTATELVRNVSEVLDRVAAGEQVTIQRNHRIVARIVPPLLQRTARDAMAALAGTLPPAAAEGWRDDARRGAPATIDELRNPWAR